MKSGRGAVAVMSVILMSLLLIIGALAVDLGNAWARKRDMQTQADVAADARSQLGQGSGPSSGRRTPELNRR